ncbi:MAG: FtsW/RodA/SpoVE family cell cycle protein [Acidobacteriaceae bacterium]|nr:FtsW/RodA/SpoVE family cell cycle protein [Acidobacteriaceae bacterium]
MAVTRTWENELAIKLKLFQDHKPVERSREFFWLLAAALVVSAGLVLVLLAKTQDFSELSTKLEHREVIDLNRVSSSDELLPLLQIFTNPDERQAAAQRIFEYIEEHRPLPNVGALAHIRVSQSSGNANATRTAPLLPLAKLKPQIIVRTPGEFRHTYPLWIGVYLLAFWAVHFLWRWRRFCGDPAILPALHLLTGMGLILMVSLRDPLRDTLEFKKFAWGVACGCALLVWPVLKVFQYRNFSRWIYTPLLAAFALFAALVAFGSGPTGSDAKVNLGPFQPVELIKILVVMFLAGYFARRWEWLRDLRQKNFVPRWLHWPDLPRLGHTLPVITGVACALAIFFLLKDMGPALVMGFVFIGMFAVARARSGLPLLAVIVLVAGVTIGYRIGAPHTVVERVSIWLSPWDNNVRGGDQVAHALWAFATGGPWGSGPGWGDPGLIPAGHTDLILPSIGEEWGFVGVLAVAVLFLFLIARAFCIALHAPDEYGFFLAFGLGTLIALEMLLISGGALGAIPLSGVVSPFLSSGNTAMLANFLIFAILLSVSNQSVRAGTDIDSEDVHDSTRVAPLFGRGVEILSLVLAACAVALVIRDVRIQVMHDRELLSRDAHVIAQDGVKRAEHNPRLNLLAASIPRGDIYDRNGVLLATSNWNELEKHREEYERLGVSIDQACSRIETRHYPFGAATVHLLGDFRTHENFEATNSSLVERDSGPKLQGYRSYADLVPVVRYRHQRGNPALQALLNRDRRVFTSIDIRLELKAAEILRSALEPKGKKGAVVVLDPVMGDVLALANWPAPDERGHNDPDELLDRARYGEYPPGSTFKLVTAMAALRLDPKATQARYSCHGLGDGRVGTIIPGWRRPIRDDIGDHAHGTLVMAQAITVSCNAYFAQLGVFKVGAQALHDTASVLGIPAGDVSDIKKMMPFAAYGQGPVLVTPFKMARVAATISAGGAMPQGRWILDTSISRMDKPLPVLAPDSATFLARAMRSVVTSGTGRSAMAGLKLAVAGKTGTAQLDTGEPHSWFAGFAPYDQDASKRIAFAVIVEHGGYGAKFAAPIARRIVEAAEQLGIISEPSDER